MYLYVHGFNSDVRSRSYFDLHKILGNVFALSYDYAKPASLCFATLCEQVEGYLDENETKKLGHNKLGHENLGYIKILGSSLGGFWAMYLAKKYNLPCLAFNPVTFGHEQLRPFLGLNQNFYTQAYWNFTEETLLSYTDFILDKNLAIKPHIILGNQDEILDYTIALNYWNNDATCIITQDVHSIMDYSQYKSLMESL